MIIHAVSSIAKATLGYHAPSNRTLVRAWAFVLYTDRGSKITQHVASTRVSAAVRDALLEAGPQLAFADQTDKIDLFVVEASKAIIERATMSLSSAGGAKVGAPGALDGTLRVGLTEYPLWQAGLNLSDMVDSRATSPLYQRISEWVRLRTGTAALADGKLIAVSAGAPCVLAVVEVPAVNVDADIADLTEESLVALTINLDRNFIDPARKVQFAAVRASRIRSGLVQQIGAVTRRVHGLDTLQPGDLPYGLPSFTIADGTPASPTFRRFASAGATAAQMEEAAKEFGKLVDFVPAAAAAVTLNHIKGDKAELKTRQNALAALARDFEALFDQIKECYDSMSSPDERAEIAMNAATDDRDCAKAVLLQEKIQTKELLKALSATKGKKPSDWVQGNQQVRMALMTLYMTRRYKAFASMFASALAAAGGALDGRVDTPQVTIPPNPKMFLPEHAVLFSQLALAK